MSSCSLAAIPSIDNIVSDKMAFHAGQVVARAISKGSPSMAVAFKAGLHMPVSASSQPLPNPEQIKRELSDRDCTTFLGFVLAGGTSNGSSEIIREKPRRADSTRYLYPITITGNYSSAVVQTFSFRVMDNGDFLVSSIVHPIPNDSEIYNGGVIIDSASKPATHEAIRQLLIKANED